MELIVSKNQSEKNLFPALEVSESWEWGGNWVHDVAFLKHWNYREMLENPTADKIYRNY